MFLNKTHPESAKELSSTDLFAYMSLQSLQRTYLPWSLSSLKPEAVQQVVNEIFVNRRARVVEFGSGISSYFIGQALQARGGHLLSIDHDALWQKEVLSWGGLSDPKIATMQHAPLTAFNHDGLSGEWYDASVVERALSEFGRIDLMLIDGPPAYRHELMFSRYPAIRATKDLLAESCCIILDDVNRKGEQEVAKRWTAVLGGQFQHRIHERAGVAMWWRGSRYGSDM